VKNLIAGLLARVLSAGAAVGAMTAGVGVVVVALSFTGYALLRDFAHWSPAACSAVVTAIYGLLLVVGAMIVAGKAKGPKAKPLRHPQLGAGDPSFLGRIADVGRERPVIAAAAAIAAGLLAWKNPRLVATVLRAFEPRDRRDY
jgi:hypothetical protein